MYDLTSQGTGRNGGPNGTTVEQIANLDRLIYDIQEVGTRFRRSLASSDASSPRRRRRTRP
ncbi:hypothetical protein D8S78_22200 [Natrialba swarupiae]|nr:hypothetical protein [Natrialba swarupiae]